MAVREHGVVLRWRSQKSLLPLGWWAADGPDFQGMRALLGLCKIVTDLELEPHFRICIEGEGKPQCHFCRYTTMAVDEVAQRLSSHAKHACPLGDGEPMLFQALPANDLARVNGIN